MKLSENERAFFALVRAGLWEHDAWLLLFNNIDFNEVFRLAQEQSVVGLVAAGVEHVRDVNVPMKYRHTFIGNVLLLEQRNKAMNDFISSIIYKMRKADIYAVLVKGQGTALCYERPLWRDSGDIDLFLSEYNYQAAKEFLKPLASHVYGENKKRLHIGMIIDSWVVELHGTMHSDYSLRVNKGLDVVQNRIFDGKVRNWIDNGVNVFLPSADNDVIIIFSHILQHFFVEGIGLRQICDWCRLIWTYHMEIDVKLLEKQLKSMGLMSEWKSFAALAVDYLGLPVNVMPCYNSSKRWHRKGHKIMALILDTGNFGHSRDMSYKQKDVFVVRLAKSFMRRNKDTFHHFLIFPLDAMRMWVKMLFMGIGVAVKGK